MREKYIERLLACMRTAELDAVLISPGEELRFLFGINPMLCERFQGMFVKADGSLFYICNLLYLDELRAALPEQVQLYPWFDGEVMTEVVRLALEEQGLLGGRIGVNMTAQAFNILAIMEQMEVSFVNGKPVLEEMRIHKDLDELEALRQSAAIVDQLFEEVQAVIRPGVTERTVQEFLLRRMRELGGEGAGCLVAAGPNSSYPHYCGGDGVIGAQDVVLLDYGCTFRGMYSDMSRTVFVGDVTGQQRECYELVRRSNEAAEALATEGAWIPDIDARARKVLDEKGYAKTLINRLGHGVGYTIHEAPDIKQSNRRVLERGMAFSIEPGIYLGGNFGIRIEDIVIINENGEREVLNQATKDLIIL